jgi:hypothetical protein
MYDCDETKGSLKQLQGYSNGAISKAQLANQRYIKRLLWFILFALVAVSAYLLDQRPVSISIDKALLALGIIWLGFLPSLLYLLDRNRPPMPFFPLVGIFYATSFGLPIFASEQKIPGRWSLANVSSTALILVLLGVAGMTIAFFASKSLLWKSFSPIRLPGPYPLGKLLTLLWLLLLSHLAFLCIPSVREIPSVGQLLDPIGYLAYGMFYIIWSRGYLSSPQIWLLLGVFVPLEIMQRLVSGTLAQLMLLGLFMIILIWYERKRIPITLISITLIFFMAFNSVKGEYRYLTWAGGRFSQVSVIEKVQLFIDLAVRKYQNNGISSQGKNFYGSDFNSVISRTAHIAVFSEVVKDTPTRVAYWGGETYLPLITSYIPRILFPDKPTERTGNNFGRRYNYLGRNDYTTSFNLPWIIEMYANFGDLGVLIGMPLVGLLLAFLEQKLNYPGMNPLEFVIGATVLFRLVYQESNLSLMTGSVLTLSLALYVLFKVYLGAQRQRSL